MDALARLLTGGLKASTPAPDADFWYQPVGPISASGVRVSPEQAETVSAFYRGVWLLSNTLAALPLFVYRRLPDGGKERAQNHPLYDVLHTQPNPWQTSFEWRRMKGRHLILRGNAYDRIVPGRRGFADALWPLHPDYVRPEQLDSGRIVYHVRQPKSGTTTIYAQDDIFHLRGQSDDGVTGKSVIAWARDSIGLAMATEGYASRLFDRGAQHGGVLTHPGVLNDEAAERMAKSFSAQTAGPSNWHRPVILEEGVTWTPVTMTAEDSQYLLSRKFSVVEMARWLGVPPHKLFDLERATFSNIEHQGIEFVVDDLTPWLVLWEQAISRDLILATDTYFAEFNLEGLLRGDSTTRADFHSKLFGVGALSQNDIRRRENMNAIPNGDTYFVQGAMRPSDQPYQASGQPAPREEERPSRRSAQASAIAQVSAERLLRKEIQAVQKMAVKHAADSDAFAGAVTDWYAKHAALVAATLNVPQAAAEAYCAGQASQILTGSWVAALAMWRESGYAAGLAGLALDEELR
jgi:HK97 family phage portal protein